MQTEIESGLFLKCVFKVCTDHVAYALFVTLLSLRTLLISEPKDTRTLEKILDYEIK